MSTEREFAKEIAERIDGLGPVTVRRFFSGFGLVADDVQFAFVMDGSLYLRVDEEFRAACAAMGAKPFVYEGKKNPITVSSYYEVPEDVIYDPDELRKWAVRSHRAAAAARLSREPKKKASAPRIGKQRTKTAAKKNKTARKASAKSAAPSRRSRRS